MKTKQWPGLLLVLSLGLVLVWLLYPTEEAEVTSKTQASSRLQLLLSQPDQSIEYASAVPAYRLRFPEDHISHDRFAIEWWYLTTNLRAVESGRHFGAQFTIFRRAMPPPQEVANDWQQPQLYMGHIAVTDTSAKQHISAQRFSRQGPGLAGSAAQPLSIWLEGWQLKADQPEQLFPATLEAWDAEQQFGYRLKLVPEKPLTLQGENGYSAKHSDQAMASHYYSYTRLKVTGELILKKQRIPVEGAAWYDHEWTSGTLAADQIGWDWFALQLDDGRDMTVIRLRNQQSSDKDYWQLSMVGPSGKRLPLSSQRPRLTVTDYWQSDDGVRYPSGWRLQLDDPPLDLTIKPRLADQEMRHLVRYWEGALEVSGSHAGQGYVELTGYDQSTQTD